MEEDTALSSEGKSGESNELIHKYPQKMLFLNRVKGHGDALSTIHFLLNHKPGASFPLKPQHIASAHGRQLGEKI